MRAVFVGASALSVSTARILLERGHDVVIIERDKDRIEELSEELDCGFLHGDGAKPLILKEADPSLTDLLFCLTGNDQTNIIASLVGRSLGFGRVITRIEDSELEHICIELGLEDTIIPTRTIGRYLADMLSGQDILELSAMVRDEVRFFAFVARDEDAGRVSALRLPRRARVIYLYRGEDFHPADPDTELREGDEVMVVCHYEDLADLEGRWGVKTPANRHRGHSAMSPG
jgi:trk system potassium uptake protein TrkA